MKSFRFRIKTLMAIVLGAALWMAVGIAMVRASTTQRQKETAVLVVVLVPLGCVANALVNGYVERHYIDPMFTPANPDCPDCGAPLPIFRVPKSLRQALWGGSFCPACGCEVDRKGGKIGRRPRP